MTRPTRAPAVSPGSILQRVPNDASTVDYRALLEEERRSLQVKLEELGVGGDGLIYDSNFADSSQVTSVSRCASRPELEGVGGP